MNTIVRSLLIFCVLLCSKINVVKAQSILNKTISIEVRKQPLEKVLQAISIKGNFYFSYNSNIVNGDSLVTILAADKSIRQVLEQLFSHKYQFNESGNYIIIRHAPVKLTIITNKAIVEDKFYVVTGHVLDERTGEGVNNASIYEKQRLVSTLTNTEGFFKLRLKSKYEAASLTVSKQFYEDTTVVIQPKYNQEITITIIPFELSGSVTTISPLLLDIIKDTATIIAHKPAELVIKRIDTISKVEKTAVGRLIVGSMQKIQGLNLQKFFTEKAFQVSLVPGLSTHGKLSPQVVNNVSFNILGGYTAGVNGVEYAGLFNINKKSMKYVQGAGLFNIVGDSMIGVQSAGINNLVFKDAKGVQLAGITNTVKGKVFGIQAAGIYNHAGDSLTGCQMAGIANFTGKETSGIQMAGISNFTNNSMDGVQMAGIINYAKKLKGVQIGLVNIADTSSGYSIGLVNIVLKGYHQLIVSSNDVMLFNAAFKSGNSKLYSILLGGLHTGKGRRVYSFGYGIGTDLHFSKRFSASTELTCQQLYLGSWNYTNLLNKVNINLNYRVSKGFSIFVGRSLSIYYSNQPAAIDGYKFTIAPNTDPNEKTNAWVGWQAGFALF